ncbi:MAG: hypothetical protein NTV87_06260 [Ignavibacteriae bacterium]|nr:hypothetical protein [Ignavibacteriota bacterium]
MNRKISKSISVIITVLFVFTSVVFYSCNKDDNDITSSATISTGLTGQWQFTITPLYHYIDTTMIKGKNGYDFKADPSINDEIYLYESNNQIRGFTGPIEFRGLKTDSIRLGVFEPVDGRYGVDTSMIKSAEMVLKQNSMGFLEGSAKIVLDRDTTGVIFDTYTIFGRKIGNITTDNINNLRNFALASWSDKICSIAGDLASFICGILSDRVFRPMANCWGTVDGGGFYVFGNTGPGSILPVWTVTCYYPFEWSACKAREYDFNINYGGPVTGLTELEALVKAEASWLNNIGYTSDSLIVAEIESFYNIYGNFAITIAHDVETQGMAIYVNVENGSTIAHTHPLIQRISNTISHYFNGVWLYSGRNISDSWYLRRSDFLVCNTPVIFYYLFGTASVNYN